MDGDGSHILLVSHNSVYMGPDIGYTTPVSALVLLSSDSGATWTKLNTSAPGKLPADQQWWRGAAVSSDGSHMLVCGYDSPGVVYISGDYGVTWTHQNTGAAEKPPAGGWWTAGAIDSDGSSIIAVGHSNAYTSADYGSTWTRQSTGAVNKLPSGVSPWQSAAMDSDGTHMLVGSKSNSVSSDGGVFTSADSGATWVRQTTDAANKLPSNGSWRGVAIDIDGSNMVVVGATSPSDPDEANDVYTSVDSGATWVRQTTGAVGKITTTASWQDAAVNSDGSHILVVAFSGEVYTSTNSGSTWTQQSTNATRKLPNNAQWRAATMSATGSRMLVAAQTGEVYDSTNGGTTWRRQNPSP